MKLHFWQCFKLFPSSKIDFWPFLKLQKIEFLNFLAHCGAIVRRLFFEKLKEELQFFRNSKILLVLANAVPVASTP